MNSRVIKCFSNYCLLFIVLLLFIFVPSGFSGFILQYCYQPYYKFNFSYIPNMNCLSIFYCIQYEFCFKSLLYPICILFQRFIAVVPNIPPPIPPLREHKINIPPAPTLNFLKNNLRFRCHFFMPFIFRNILSVQTLHLLRAH